jgi:NAD(P)-dependent dehydrogenase (short-subunit alcohol dehydrogenase family)
MTPEAGDQVGEEVRALLAGAPAPAATHAACRLDGRTVFVAGGGSAGPGWSIGRAACVTYARLGAAVCVADRDPASAEQTAACIAAEGGRAIVLVGDVADPDDVRRLFAEANAALGDIDVLHHNVGIGKVAGPCEIELADWDRINDVNVRSLLLASREVLPRMAERGRGVILSVSSVAGMRYVGYPHLAYSVTKAAVTHLTKMIALQYASQGVRANTIVPGLIDTPRIAQTVAKMYSSESLDEARQARARQVPVGRMGSAWDIANAAAFLASDAAAYITGTELVIDGGLTAKFG